LNEFICAVGLDKVNFVPSGVLYLMNINRKCIVELVRKYRGKDPKDIIVVDSTAGRGSIQ